MTSSLLQQLLEKSFNKHSDRNALWIKKQFYSYSQLAQKMNGVITLMNGTVADQKLIAIIAHNTIETYATIMAVWTMGIGFVPVSPSFPEDRIYKILNEAAINFVFTSECKDIEKYKRFGITFCCTKEYTAKNNKMIPVERNENNVACMLFTSGSTGIPKGVPMTYKNIDITLDSYLNFGYGPDQYSRCLQMFEFTFDMSLISYLPAFIAGACVYSINDDNYRFMTAFKIIEEHKLTFAVFVPSALGFMQRYFESFYFPSLQCTLVGGEPFSVTLAHNWFQCAPNTRIINISGPTETTMACMGYEVSRNVELNKNLNGILAFGKPWKNTTAIVIDEKFEILSSGEKGELCFAGEHVMKGYWNNKEKNKNVFFSKTFKGTNYIFYRTGDGAFYDEEGDYYTCGRIDLQVKIQGYRVEPGEIEAIALKETGNILLAAIPYKKHEGFYAIRLFIENKAIDPAELLNRLKEKLPAYMVPEEILLLDTFPLNMNGKIDRVFLQKSLENNE